MYELVAKCGFGIARNGGYGARMLSRFFGLFMLLAILALNLGGERQFRANRDQRITVYPVSLDPDRPELRRAGTLEYLAGWVLESRNNDFGGLSALAILSGNRLMAVSDAGTVVTFDTPKAGRSGQLAANIAPLPWTGAEEPTFRDRDSESLAVDPVSGRVWIGFEQNHAIRRYSAGIAREERTARPKDIQNWGDNSGAEVLVRLKDGRFLTMSESRREKKGHTLLVYPRDPASVRPVRPLHAYYDGIPDYSPTDAAQLPDGRLLILHRRLSATQGFVTLLAVADIAGLEEGAVLESKVIARLEPPLTVDNMEGIAVAREDGRTVVWLISDDNFIIFQRTLLMKFALDENDAKKTDSKSVAAGFESLNR